MWSTTSAKYIQTKMLKNGAKNYKHSPAIHWDVEISSSCLQCTISNCSFPIQIVYIFVSLFVKVNSYYTTDNNLRVERDMNRTGEHLKKLALNRKGTTRFRRTFSCCKWSNTSFTLISRSLAILVTSKTKFPSLFSDLHIPQRESASQNCNRKDEDIETEADSVYLFRTDLTSISLSASSWGDVCINVVKLIRSEKI
jgi:hypothetical protein